jgi:hypothetical protein
MAEIAASPEAQARQQAGQDSLPRGPEFPVPRYPQPGGPDWRQGMPQPPLSPGTERPIQPLPWPKTPRVLPTMDEARRMDYPAPDVPQPPYATGRGNLEPGGYFQNVAAPNGQTYRIPQNKLQEALMSGGRKL